MSGDPKVAVVTGANRGIGLAVCRHLAGQGVRVLLGSREASKGTKAVAALTLDGLDTEAVELDVTSDDSVSALRKDIEKRFGGADILINNAGVLLDQGASVFSPAPDSFRQTMAVNFYGAMRMCREFIPVMIERGYGRVVNISSGWGALTDMEGFQPAYRVSKTALNALTRIVAAEAGDCNVKVNSVCPGWVQTEMGGEEAPVSVEEAAEGIVWAATLSDDGPTGGFFRYRESIDW